MVIMDKQNIFKGILDFKESMLSIPLNRICYDHIFVMKIADTNRHNIGTHLHSNVKVKWTENEGFAMTLKESQLHPSPIIHQH